MASLVENPSAALSRRAAMNTPEFAAAVLRASREPFYAGTRLDDNDFVRFVSRLKPVKKVPTFLPATSNIRFKRVQPGKEIGGYYDPLARMNGFEAPAHELRVQATESGGTATCTLTEAAGGGIVIFNVVRLIWNQDPDELTITDGALTSSVLHETKNSHMAALVENTTTTFSGQADTAQGALVDIRNASEAQVAFAHIAKEPSAYAETFAANGMLISAGQATNPLVTDSADTRGKLTFAQAGFASGKAGQLTLEIVVPGTEAYEQYVEALVANGVYEEMK